MQVKNCPPSPHCHTALTSILLRVSVPVLSVHMHVQPPSVSTALSLRITTFLRLMRVTPKAIIMVTTAGSPSGMAATAMATEVMNERSISPRASAEKIKITAATATTNAEIILPSLSKLRSRGVLLLVSPSNMSAIAPICVLRPTPVTTAVALPRTTKVEANSMLYVPPSGVFGVLITPSRLSTAVDSPVSADSSAFKEEAAIMRQSAGTRSPSSRRIMSPGVSSAAGILIAVPPRTATAVGVESFLRLSIALSALYC